MIRARPHNDDPVSKKSTGSRRDPYPQLPPSFQEAPKIRPYQLREDGLHAGLPPGALVRVIGHMDRLSPVYGILALPSPVVVHWIPQLGCGHLRIDHNGHHEEREVKPGTRGDIVWLPLGSTARLQPDGRPGWEVTVSDGGDVSSAALNT